MSGPPSTPPPERAALSRELADFLIELSIALHKHAMYPEGHPSLAPAAAGVTRRAERLLEERASLSLGVAGQQLVIEGVATDPKHPVLAELAGRLHRHHLGALTFHRGLRTEEVAAVLRTLSVEADRSGEPLGLGPPERLRAWEHIRLHSLTYERLELMDTGDAPPDSTASGSAAGSARLWVGLARAALAADAGAEDSLAPTEPAIVAEAIDRNAGSAGYDQVIVGYLLQIAEDLKTAGGAEAAALRRRTSKLIGAMRPETLRRLVDMGGDAAQRRKFALDATHGLAVDAVLDVVRAMADASHQSVSHSMVRMLSKLAVHAEQGPEVARLQADGALRDQVRRLLDGWTLDDPNPTAYGRALQRMASAAPVALAAAEAKHAAEPLRLVQTGFEVGTLGPVAWRAVERLLDEGRTGALLDVLERAPTGAGSVAETWERVISPEGVKRVVTTDPPDFVTLDRLLPRLPPPAFEPLLDALAASESRTTRRALLDRLARAPAEVADAVASRLGADAPWYVTRNLLIVLDGLPRLPSGFLTAPFAAHADARVRREALKLALKVPAEREAALLVALRDSDPRTTRLALIAALEGCPTAAVPLVVAIALDAGRSPDVRVPAIRVLGRTRQPSALAGLLQVADGGRSMFGRRKLAARSIELVAAVAALVTGWAGDPRARALVAVAAASKDPELRRATDAERIER
jgi:hypothetical protein